MNLQGLVVEIHLALGLLKFTRFNYNWIFKILNQTIIYLREIVFPDFELLLLIWCIFIIVVSPYCLLSLNTLESLMNIASISWLFSDYLIIHILQLIGVPVPGLEPEFQPVVSHLLPHIIAHKQDAQDVHLQVDDICCHLIFSWSCFKLFHFISDACWSVAASIHDMQIASFPSPTWGDLLISFFIIDHLLFIMILGNMEF